jgi:hypothetical protein
MAARPLAENVRLLNEWANYDMLERDGKHNL